MGTSKVLITYSRRPPVAGAAIDRLDARWVPSHGERNPGDEGHTRTNIIFPPE